MLRAQDWRKMNKSAAPSPTISTNYAALSPMVSAPPAPNLAALNKPVYLMPSRALLLARLHSHGLIPRSRSTRLAQPTISSQAKVRREANPLKREIPPGYCWNKPTRSEEHTSELQSRGH